MSEAAAAGKAPVQHANINKKRAEEINTNKLTNILAIINIEKEKYIGSKKVDITKVRDIFQIDVDNNEDLNEILFRYYNHSKLFVSTFLVLLGIGLECPDAIGDRDSDKFYFVRNYYEAIINVYEKKYIESTRTQENLYTFIMSYFKTVC